MAKFSKTQSKAKVVTVYERELRQEVSKLASKANKRLQRLEARGLTDSPAYRSVVENGVPKFGVRGKSFNEVQQELSRLNRFLDAGTSTIRGINANLKNIAKITGVEYKNLQDLRGKTAKFFELASKVEQYLRTVDDMASAIGYQKIWEAINTYVKDNEYDLSDSGADIDKLTHSITQTLKTIDGSNDGDKKPDLKFDGKHIYGLI